MQYLFIFSIKNKPSQYFLNEIRWVKFIYHLKCSICLTEENTQQTHHPIPDSAKKGRKSTVTSKLINITLQSHSTHSNSTIWIAPNQTKYSNRQINWGRAVSPQRGADWNLINMGAVLWGASQSCPSLKIVSSLPFFKKQCAWQNNHFWEAMNSGREELYISLTWQTALQ